jgi:hypothetical protein
MNGEMAQMLLSHSLFGALVRVGLSSKSSALDQQLQAGEMTIGVPGGCIEHRRRIACRVGAAQARQHVRSSRGHAYAAH